MAKKKSNNEICNKEKLAESKRKKGEAQKMIELGQEA